MTPGRLSISCQSDVGKWVKATAVSGHGRCCRQPDGDTGGLNALRVPGKCAMKVPDVFKRVDDAMKAKWRSSRYHAINLTDTAAVGFRKGRGSINADRIIAVVTMTGAICLYCRDTEPPDLSLEDLQSWLFRNIPCGNPIFRYLHITQPDA